MKIKYLVLAVVLCSVEVHADNSTRDAAIGSGIGGAAGAAIGNEVGGREGAIIGGAVGGAIGAAVGIEEHSHQPSAPEKAYKESAQPRSGHPKDYHCPPGQRKKGRC